MILSAKPAPLAAPVPDSPDRIPLTRPYMDDAIKARVAQVLDSGWYTEGPVTKELEAACCGYFACRHAVAVTSATTGFEAALRAIDIQPGDEVIVPDYTYPSTASIPALLGAVAVIVDVDPRSMLISPQALADAITPRTRAVMPVSLFGNPVDYDAVRAAIAGRPIRIIEDAACGLGAEYQGRMVAAQPDMAVFSLHPRKILTTGEGGIITTDDDDLAKWLRCYKNFGCVQRDGGYFFDILGTNYKISDICAAVAAATMPSLPRLVGERRRVAAAYDERFRDNPRISISATTPGGRHAYQSYPVFVERRDEIMTGMRARNIEVQIGTHALHRHPAFHDTARVRLMGPMRGAEYAYTHCLVLPMFPGMTDAQIDRVVETLTRLVESA